MESEQLKFWAGSEVSGRFFRGAEGLDPEYRMYVLGVIGLCRFLEKEASARLYL